jgi:hypothetical protein
MRLLENLADRTGYIGRSMKRSIIGSDVSLPYADWNGHAEKFKGDPGILNRLVREKECTQVINSPTRGNALLDVYLVKPESAFTSCSIVQGSVTIAEYFWKWNGEKIAVSFKWKN